jgi:hypothetical protein
LYRKWCGAAGIGLSVGAFYPSRSTRVIVAKRQHPGIDDLQSSSSADLMAFGVALDSARLKERPMSEAGDRLRDCRAEPIFSRCVALIPPPPSLSCFASWHFKRSHGRVSRCPASMRLLSAMVAPCMARP